MKLKPYHVVLTLGFATVGETEQQARERAAGMLENSVAEFGAAALMEKAKVLPVTQFNPENN